MAPCGYDDVDHLVWLVERMRVEYPPPELIQAAIELARVWAEYNIPDTAQVMGFTRKDINEYTVAELLNRAQTRAAC